MSSDPALSVDRYGYLFRRAAGSINNVIDRNLRAQRSNLDQTYRNRRARRAGFMRSDMYNQMRNTFDSRVQDLLFAAYQENPYALDNAQRELLEREERIEEAQRQVREQEEELRNLQDRINDVRTGQAPMEGVELSELENLRQEHERLRAELDAAYAHLDNNLREQRSHIRQLRRQGNNRAVGEAAMVSESRRRRNGRARDCPDPGSRGGRRQEGQEEAEVDPAAGQEEMEIDPPDDQEQLILGLPAGETRDTGRRRATRDASDATGTRGRRGRRGQIGDDEPSTLAPAPNRNAQQPPAPSRPAPAPRAPHSRAPSIVGDRPAVRMGGTGAVTGAPLIAEGEGMDDLPATETGRVTRRPQARPLPPVPEEEGAFGHPAPDEAEDTAQQIEPSSGQPGPGAAESPAPRMGDPNQEAPDPEQHAGHQASAINAIVPHHQAEGAVDPSGTLPRADPEARAVARENISQTNREPVRQTEFRQVVTPQQQFQDAVAVENAFRYNGVQTEGVPVDASTVLNDDHRASLTVQEITNRDLQQFQERRQAELERRQRETMRHIAEAQQQQQRPQDRPRPIPGVALIGPGPPVSRSPVDITAGAEIVDAPLPQRQTPPPPGQRPRPIPGVALIGPGAPVPRSPVDIPTGAEIVDAPLPQHQIPPVISGTPLRPDQIRGRGRPRTTPSIDPSEQPRPIPGVALVETEPVRRSAVPPVVFGLRPEQMRGRGRPPLPGRTRQRLPEEDGLVDEQFTRGPRRQRLISMFDRSPRERRRQRLPEEDDLAQEQFARGPRRQRLAPVSTEEHVDVVDGDLPQQDAEEPSFQAGIDPGETGPIATGETDRNQLLGEVAEGHAILMQSNNALWQALRRMLAFARRRGTIIAEDELPGPRVADRTEADQLLQLYVMTGDERYRDTVSRMSDADEQTINRYESFLSAIREHNEEIRRRGSDLTVVQEDDDPRTLERPTARRRVDAGTGTLENMTPSQWLATRNQDPLIQMIRGLPAPESSPFDISMIPWDDLT